MTQTTTYTHDRTGARVHPALLTRPLTIMNTVTRRQINVVEIHVYGLDKRSVGCQR